MRGDNTDWGQRVGFDQNRLFVGPTVDVPGMGRVEVGYLFLYLARWSDEAVYQSPIREDTFKHILSVQVVVGL